MARRAKQSPEVADESVAPQEDADEAVEAVSSEIQRRLSDIFAQTDNAIRLQMLEAIDKAELREQIGKDFGSDKKRAYAVVAEIEHHQRVLHFLAEELAPRVIAKRTGLSSGKIANIRKGIIVASIRKYLENPPMSCVVSADGRKAVNKYAAHRKPSGAEQGALRAQLRVEAHASSIQSPEERRAMGRRSVEAERRRAIAHMREQDAARAAYRKKEDLIASSETVGRSFMGLPSDKRADVIGFVFPLVEEAKGKKPEDITASVCERALTIPLNPNLLLGVVIHLLSQQAGTKRLCKKLRGIRMNVQGEQEEDLYGDETGGEVDVSGISDDGDDY